MESAGNTNKLALAKPDALNRILSANDDVRRKVRYRLYPSKSQHNKLSHMLVMHQRLYNSALEHRIGAYRKAGVSISYYDQAKELTVLRKECPEYAKLNAQSSQATLKRLDRAYQSFFRRVKQGQKAGFPRFKSIKRFRGWSYATHGDGWRFHIGKHGLNGYVKVSGVGYIQARGRPRTDDFTGDKDPGTPKVMDIVHEDGKWYASVTFKRTMPGRRKGYLALGIDWGTSRFLTVASQKGQRFSFANPRLMREFQDKLKAHQKLLSRKKRGSKNRNKQRANVVKLHRKLANKRQDHLHKTSAKVVQLAKHIATEKLNIKNMTAKGGRYKAGLNRSILDTAPGDFFEKLRYKAEEAGVQWTEIPTGKVKPSQTCCACGKQQKKSLAERIHSCSCGFVADRDVNAALVMINFALTGVSHCDFHCNCSKVTGQELALGVESGVARMVKHETPPIPPQALSETEAVRGM